MNIDYTVKTWKEGSQYIAHALPLDVMSSGVTPEDAKNALREAVHLFLETAKDMGTLEDILDECGYEFREDEQLVLEEQAMPAGAHPLEGSGESVFGSRLSFCKTGRKHRSYIKPGILRPVVIPAYTEVPVAIIKNNLKTAGISRDQYFKLLGKG